MRFPHKAYDQMIAAEKAAEIPVIKPEKKEDVKKEESVFDDPEKQIISESDPEPEAADPEDEGGAENGN